MNSNSKGPSGGTSDHCKREARIRVRVAENWPILVAYLDMLSDENDSCNEPLSPKGRQAPQTASAPRAEFQSGAPLTLERK